jgi:plasmid maintenance system antidote protein VapI
MKTRKMVETGAQLSPELAELLEKTPIWTEEKAKQLEAAALDLDNDPQFMASVLKSKFVNEVYVGMEECGLNKNMLAQKWGKTRQYLSRVLNEGKRVNFTIETMVELANLLGKRVVLNVVGRHETCAVHRLPIRQHRVEEFGVSKASTKVSPIYGLEFGHTARSMSKVMHEDTALAA